MGVLLWIEVTGGLANDVYAPSSRETRAGHNGTEYLSFAKVWGEAADTESLS